MNLPDIESLRCFVEAADHLNFSAAAKVVALSAQAFGERIANLESTLGARLFERTTRKVSLTAAGFRVLPHVRRVVADASALTAMAMADGTAPNMRLRVGTRFELGMSWLVPSVLGLEQARVGRTIDVVFGDSPDLMRSLAENRVDCVISSLRLTTPGIGYATLHEECYLFVAAPGLVSTTPMGCAHDAAKHTLLDNLPSLPLFRYFLDAASGEDAWTFQKTRHLGTIAGVRHLAIAGAGLAVLPQYFVQDALDDGRLVRLMPEVTLNRDYFRLIWKDGHVLANEFHLLARDLAKIPLR